MTTYYVHHAGDNSSATTDPGTGGVWSSAYESVAFALDTGVATNGDIIRVSDQHSKDHGGATTIPQNYGGAVRNPCLVISVDHNDTAVYSKGAAEGTTTGGMLIDHITMWGMVISAATGTTSQAAGCALTFADCTLATNGTGTSVAIVAASGDNVSMTCIDCVFDKAGTGTTTRMVNIGSASKLRIYGGSVTTSGGGTITALADSNFANGGGTIRCIGCDLSVIATYILGGVGSSRTADDIIDIQVISSIVKTSITLSEEGFSHPNHHIAIWNTDDTTGDLNERFEDLRHNGSAVNEGTVRRTATPALPNGNFLTVKSVTTSNCSVMEPYEFQIPAFYADLSVAGTDLATLYLTSAATLDDLEVQAWLVYPDGTTAVQANVAAGFPQASSGWARNPLSSATTLTTTSGLWTSPQTNQYKIDIDTSGDVAQASPNVAPELWIRLTGASQTIYFDRSVDLS